MLQNPRKILGFKKNMVYKIPPGGGGKPYPASGLIIQYFFITQHRLIKKILFVHCVTFWKLHYALWNGKCLNFLENRPDQRADKQISLLLKYLHSLPFLRYNLNKSSRSYMSIFLR